MVHGSIQNKVAFTKFAQVVGDAESTFRALIREYLFVSIYEACAESMAAENASRLEAMERAEKNIEGMLVELNLGYNRLRQSTIDEELFDVVAGFKAQKKKLIVRSISTSPKASPVDSLRRYFSDNSGCHIARHPSKSP